jgi:hypothetical protein
MRDLIEFVQTIAKEELPKNIDDAVADADDNTLCDAYSASIRNITTARALIAKVSWCFEIHVFPMADLSSTETISEALMAPAKTYDIAVSFKIADEIVEIDEVEGIDKSQIESSLAALAEKYPHATVHMENVQ